MASQLRESFVKRLIILFFSDNFRFVRRIKGNHWVQYDMAHYGSYCSPVWYQLTHDEWHGLKRDRQHGNPRALRCLRFEHYADA
jgi:hypothetical protein